VAPGITFGRFFSFARPSPGSDPSASRSVYQASTWAGAAPDGYTLMLGYVGTHAMNPALQRLG